MRVSPVTGCYEFVDGDGNPLVSALGLGFAVFTAETGAGVVGGLAVAYHGWDVATAGWDTLVSGTLQDSMTSQSMQSIGVPRDWANGIDAAISVGGSMGVGAAASASVHSGEWNAETVLYRAVNPEEAASIQRLGRFTQHPGKSAGSGKYFTTSIEEARRYGDMASKAFHEPPYQIFGTRIPSSSLPSLGSVDGGINSYIISPDLLQTLKPFPVNP